MGINAKAPPLYETQTNYGVINLLDREKLDGGEVPREISRITQCVARSSMLIPYHRKSFNQNAAISFGAEGIYIHLHPSVYVTSVTSRLGRALPCQVLSVYHGTFSTDRQPVITAKNFQGMLQILR